MKVIIPNGDALHTGWPYPVHSESQQVSQPFFDLLINFYWHSALRRGDALDEVPKILRYRQILGR